MLIAALGLPLMLARGWVDSWVTFEDVARKSGIEFVHRASPTPKKYLIETMGSGVALLDFDGDGFLDIYLANGARIEPGMKPGTVPDKSDPAYWNRLFHNNHDWTFTDVTRPAGVAGKGYSTGVAVGDFDGDGRPDLYVAGFPSNQLFRNNGDGTFTDVTARAGVAGGGWSTSAGFFDYDNDGDLDLFVCRYMKWDLDDLYCGDSDVRAYCDPKHFPPISNLLYRNQGNGTFDDVSRTSGIEARAGKGLGVAFNDFDGDGRPDVFVANDGVPQFLFLIQGDGTFREDALELGAACDENGNTFAGMGVDGADYNDDGWPDVLVTTLSLETYALFRNLQGKAFDYATNQSGLGRASRLHAGWGTFFFDADNNSAQDIFVAQGHVLDTIQRTNPALSYLQPPLLLRNQGGVFSDVSKRSGAGFELPNAGRGAAYGDLDNDGNLDLVVSNLNRPVQVMRNTGDTNRSWLMLELQGRGMNREGIGAKVRLQTSGRPQYRYASRAVGYLSSSEARVHFGLRETGTISEITVRWPSGKVQRLQSVPAGRRVTVSEP